MRRHRAGTVGRVTDEATDPATDPATAGRWLTMQGAHNVRDLGGLPLAAGGFTRHGRVLRADALDALTPVDVELLAATFGLRHVVDLRSSGERAERGRGPLGALDGLSYTEVEVIPVDALARRRDARAAAFERGNDTDVIMGEGYVELLEIGAPAFRSALVALAAADGVPALFHCSAGKDRTGVLAALLLGLAGADREAIVADYALTEERVPAIVLRLTGAASFDELAKQVPVFSFQAKAGTMRHLLDRIDERWGGAAGYARSLGIDDDAIGALRSLLV